MAGQLPRIVSAEHRDFAAVVARELAQPGLGAQAQVMMDFRAGLHDIERGVRLWGGAEFAVVVVGVAAMQQPAVAGPHRDTGVARGMPAERDQPDVWRQALRLDGGEPEPVLAWLGGVCNPLRAVSPVRRAVAEARRLGGRGVQFRSKDVDLGVWEVGKAAAM